jgi:integrase
MTKIRLRFVQAFVAHGRAYYYFRKPGCARIKLPGLPGSEAFMTAYQSALDLGAQPLNIGAKRSVPGTIAALVAAYIGSDTFRDLAAQTKRTRMAILQRVRDEHGTKRVALLRREHVEAMLRTKRPFPRQNLLKVLRPLMHFAISLGWHIDDPTRDIKLNMPKKGEGFRSWGETEIAAFRAHHPIGSRARLAFELLLCTVQRRSDVIKMGPQHIRDGILHVRQQKTGTSLLVPVMPELRAAIEALPAKHLTFVTTEWGKAFTPAGFGNWFRDRCNEAGLQGFSAHGLRKAGCRRLAEAGCTAHEIAAWSGHRTLREVSHYTRAADQAAMARAAEAKLRTKLSKSASHFDKSRRKANVNNG